MTDLPAGPELDARVARAMGWEWFRIATKDVLLPPGHAFRVGRPACAPRAGHRNHVDGDWFFDSREVPPDPMPRIPPFSTALGPQTLEMLRHLSPPRALVRVATQADGSVDVDDMGSWLGFGADDERGIPLALSRLLVALAERGTP